MQKTAILLGKELRVMFRDRRLILGVAVVSLVIFPLLIGFVGNADRLLASDDPVHVLVEENDQVLGTVLAALPGFQVHRERVAAEAAAKRHLTIVRREKTYRILGDLTRERLRDAARDVRLALDSVRQAGFDAALAQRGLSAEALEPFTVELVDTADPEVRSARVVSILLPYLVVILLVTNAIRAIYVAVGEKEKNTLASLLVSNVPRNAIVIGKTFAIVTFAAFASALLLVGFVGAAKLGFLFNDGEVTTVGFRLTVGQVAQLAVNILSLALFIASLVMVLGTFARSQREAGVYTAPLVFITIFLAIFSFSSSDFGLGLYAVPILGNALAMRETFLQSLGADQILLAIAGNVVLFLVMVQISAWMYRREDVMFRP